MTRTPQRGSAMLITMTLISATMAGAAVMVSLQVSSTKSAGIVRTKLSSLYCAEAGLAIARAKVAASYPLWNASLGQGEPGWLAGLDHDIDHDGSPDFTVTLRDNLDDDDLARDNDLAVFVVSTCTKYDDMPVELSELVRFNGGGNCYQAQLGGCGGNANAN